MESSVSDYLLSEYDRRAWKPGEGTTYRRGLASIKSLTNGCYGCEQPHRGYECHGGKGRWVARLSADFCEQCWLKHEFTSIPQWCTHG